MGCNSSSNARPPVRVASASQPRDVRESGPPGRVRLPSPWKSEPPITQAKLELDRTTFWETTARVQGNPRVWEALRVACEACLAGDVELCNTILEASDVATPNATLAMCYDSKGFLYELPPYLYSSPTNVVSMEEAARPKRSAHAGGTSFDVPITLRLSASNKSTEQDVLMVVRSSDLIGAVKQRLHAELVEGRHDDHTTTKDTQPSFRRGEGNKWVGAGLPPSHQRVFCQGRALPDDFTVQDCSLAPHTIVQVFIKASASGR